MPFSNPPFSNIREHALSFDHPIKVDNFSVLARCPSHDLRCSSLFSFINFPQILIIKLALFPSKFFHEELPSFMDIIFFLLQNLDTKLKKMSITSKIPEISKIQYKQKCLKGLLDYAIKIAATWVACKKLHARIARPFTLPTHPTPSIF